MVKPKIHSDLETDGLGDDWSDMFDTRHALRKFQHQSDWSEMSGERHTPPNSRYQSESVPVRETDKQFAEAMHELKKLGVEVHVWFSGDEQFTKKAGVT